MPPIPPIKIPGLGALTSIIEFDVSADKVFYVVCGLNKDIILFKDIFNDYYNKNNINKKMLVSKLNYPILNFLEKQQLNNNIKLNVAPYLEKVQCLAYGDINHREAKHIYTLICLEKQSENNYLVTYPNIKLNKNDDVEKVIANEFKKIFNINNKNNKEKEHDLQYKINQNLFNIVKSNINLVDLTGDDDDILIYNINISNTQKKNLVLKYF